MAAGPGRETRRRQNKFAESEAPLQQALDTFEKKQPGLSPVFSGQSLVGWALLGQQKYADAERLLLPAYEGLKQRHAERPSPSHLPVLRSTVERIVEVYAAWGKPEETAQWKKKLAEFDQLNPAKKSAGQSEAKIK
jgi:eukaryotic-like serine/threonine-protein kinase